MTADPLAMAALAYARDGMAVLPLHSIENGACTCRKPGCSSPAKHPRTQHGLSEASKDEDTIRRWWERWPSANVGIATGALSGIVVLDVDPKNGGDDGLVGLREEYGDLPATRTVATGGDGSHFYFRHPGVEVRNSAQRVGLGLDVRGDGGYVVAPPSLHASARNYEWLNDLEPAQLPDWLLTEMQGKRARTKERNPPVAGVGESPYGRAALDRESADVSSAPEGTRNDRLNAAAFSLGQLVGGGELEQGASEAALLDAALASGLPESEARRTLRSGIESGMQEPRTAPSPENYFTPSANGPGADDDGPAEPRPRGILCTDLGNARRLVVRHGKDLRYCASLGWFVWDGRRWKKDETGAAMRRAKETVESVWDEVKRAGTTEERDRLVKWAIRSQAAQRLTALLSVAATEAPIAVTTADFDSDAWALNVRTGTIDLRTGELRPHRREDLITKIAPVEYDPAASCPVFERFIGQVFQEKPDLIGFVQKACGYALTGDVSHQVLFFLYGEGANGKSTLMDVLLHVLGEYASPAAPDLLLARRGERHPTEIADLFGKRLVSCVEAGEKRGFNEAIVKWITGGDRLKARLMRMDFFEFPPTHKVFLSANHRPRVTETAHAFWRRIRMIPFNVVFRDRPPGATGDPAPGEKDARLPEKLRAEAAGVLRWAVEGCLRMQSEGIDPPQEVRQATDDYRQGEDLIGTFLGECCVRRDGARCGKTELYKAYVAWTEEGGEKHVANRGFRAYLLRHGVVEKRVGKKRFWSGIGLLSDHPGDPAGDAVTRGDGNLRMTGESYAREGVIPDSASPAVTASPAPRSPSRTTLYDDAMEVPF